MYENAIEQVNWSGWENANYQQLLKDARSSTDHNRQQQLLQEAEEILVEERPTIPLSIQTYLYMGSSQKMEKFVR